MGCNIVSDEKYFEINNPEYIYICKKCKIPKPNTEYSKDKSQGKGKGRGYVTQCKQCRRDYNKTKGVIESKRKRAPLSRKRNRISSVYWSSVINARAKGWEHSITKNDIIELYNIQKGLCYYSNQLMLKNIENEEDNGDSISIDRFDTTKGYIKENIVLCRWVVNKMKNDIPFTKFLEIVSQININFNK